MPFSFSMIGGLAGELLGAGRYTTGPGGVKRDKTKAKAARVARRKNRARS